PAAPVRRIRHRPDEPTDETTAEKAPPKQAPARTQDRHPRTGARPRRRRAMSSPRPRRPVAAVAMAPDAVRGVLGGDVLTALAAHTTPSPLPVLHDLRTEEARKALARTE